MYEIKATSKQREKFKKVVRARMVLKGISVKDLAEEMHYEPNTIYQFFTKGYWNRFISAYLAEKLDIREEEWR